MTRKYTLIVFAIVLIMSSCSTIRRAQRSSDEIGSGNKGKSLEEILEKNNIAGKGLIISRARIKYSDDATEASFTAVIRINKKGEILASLKSFAGIEVARVIFTDDIFYIFDRIHRTVSFISFEDVGKRYGLRKEWMMIVLGDTPGILTEKGNRIKCRDGVGERERSISGLRIGEEFDCSSGKVSEVSMMEASGRLLSTLRFNDFIKVNDIVIPSSVVMDSRSNLFHVEMIIEKVETGWDGEIDFAKPNGYELIKIR